MEVDARSQLVLSPTKRAVIRVFVLRGFGYALLFLAEARLAAQVGPAHYGTFSYALALAALLALVISLGWPAAIPRFLPEYLGTGEWGLVKGFLVRGTQLTLAVGAITAAGLLFAARLLSGSALAVSLAFAAVLVPVLAVLDVERRAFQGLKRPGASVFSEEVLLPGAFLLLVLATVPTTGAGALLRYSAVATTACVLNAVWVRRSLPDPVRSAASRFRTRYWLGITIPMVFGGIAQIVMNRTDVLMLGAMVGMQATGLYSAAHRLAMLNVFFLGAVNVVMAPLLAEAWHAGNHVRFNGLVRRAMLYSGAAALPLFLAMVLAPRVVLGVFGAGFGAGETLLRLLAIGQFINAATGPVGFALLMSGRERVFAITLGAAAALNVLGNVIAIPRWGAAGAAFVTMLSVATLNLVQFRLGPTGRGGAQARSLG